MGGKNEPGATVTSTRMVCEKDANGKKTGRLVEKEVVRKAPLGQAAQVMRLEMAGTLLAAPRKSKEQKLSEPRTAFQLVKKEREKKARYDTYQAVEQLSLEMHDAPSAASETT